MSTGILPGAHDFILYNPHFVANSTHQTIDDSVPGKRGDGIERLLKASMPDAFHDSSARDPPPSCHPGTRQNFIDDITSWALGTSRHTQRMLWMHGPAGVGKSAVAQSCAELLAEQGKLGAAFFFSRPNERDDSNTLFTSIAYQIATKSSLYNDILDHKIRKDLTRLTTSIREQFRELLVKPLQHPRTDRADVGEWLIIIDGLDECQGRETQSNIIEIVTTSVRERTTPFRWLFLSRPEPHITGSFTANDMLSLSRHLELPVSRDIDNEITLYLTVELRKIQQRSGLPDSWPTEREIGILVNLAGGLFIYAATVVRFVGRHNSSGPVDQLRTVCSLAVQGKRAADSKHPLSELDKFYTLIMQLIPSEILSTIQRILLLISYSNNPHLSDAYWYEIKVLTFANILGLTEAQFRNACGSLYSVLELDSSPEIKFHHASFMDFLQDPERSKEFCVYSCLNDLRRVLLERLNNVHSHSTMGSPAPVPKIDVTWPDFNHINEHFIYRRLLEMFFGLCQWKHPLDLSMSMALLNFEFHLIPRLWKDPKWAIPTFGDHELSPVWLTENVPTEFRNRIARRSYNPVVYLHKPSNVSWHDVYVLGRGRNKVIYWQDRFWRLVPYPGSSIFF